MTETRHRIYIIYSEGSAGEVEGAFDFCGNLLDFWSCNDASFRTEYFRGFLEKLGVEIVRPTEKQRENLERILEKAAKEAWGIEDEDEEE